MISLQDFITYYYNINGIIFLIGIFGTIPLQDSDFTFKQYLKCLSIVWGISNIMLVMWGFVPTLLYKLAYLPLQHLVK